jgi:hypothetical protein
MYMRGLLWGFPVIDISSMHRVRGGVLHNCAHTSTDRFANRLAHTRTDG